MLRIRIAPKTFADIRKYLTKLRLMDKDLQNRTRPHRQFRESMVKRWAVNFDTQGGEYDAWEPTHQATIDIHGAPKQTLSRSGALRAGFITAARGGQVKQNVTLWNFGNANPIYIRKMHFGDPVNDTAFARARHLGPIPSRKLWGLDAKDGDTAEKIFDEYVTSVINKHFK